MPRPRKKVNTSLPQYLFYDAQKKRYRFKLVDGTRKTLGSDRYTAIQIAVEYNRIMRPVTANIVDDLIKLSECKNGSSRYFGNVVDNLLNLIIKEEDPSAGLISTMRNDAERVKEYFSDLSCEEIELEHVNGYLSAYHADASANVHNRKIGFLEKLFKYAMDQSLMITNPASLKLKKRKDKKQRQRLNLDGYKKIYASSPLWLQTAMSLALQASQARLEISRIKYNIRKPKEGECGCYWFDKPEGGIYGTLFIHRQKVEEKEASHVAIPIGEEIKQVIDNSRDNIACPYVVHRRPERNNKQSEKTNHRYQLDPDYLSKAFSKVRDEIGAYDHLEKNQRPTFHEIRALSARLFADMGIDPQGRMAHTDSKSTKIYVRNHLEWTEVPHAEIKIAN